MKKDDIICVKNKQGIDYGILTSEKDGFVRYRSYDGALKRVPVSEAEPAQPLYISKDEIEQVAHLEITMDELTYNSLFINYCVYDEIYKLTVEDLYNAIKRFTNLATDSLDLLAEWVDTVALIHPSLFGLDDMDFSSDPVPPQAYFGKDDDVFLKKMLMVLLLDNNKETVSYVFDCVTGYLAVNNEGSVNLNEVNENVKSFFLDYFYYSEKLRNMSPKFKKYFRQFTNELALKDNVSALDILAKSCYGGNEVFGCDWKTARDSFERLIELTGEDQYANSLGYIYYYGRTGAPDYELAYKYFSMASMLGNIEATYKIADMFKNGYYVSKNLNVAFKMLVELFPQAVLAPFARGRLDTSFADVALRLAGVFEQWGNTRSALKYYMLARLGISLRRKFFDFYGDAKVEGNIENSLNEIKKNLTPGYQSRKSLQLDNLNDLLFEHMLTNDYLHLEKNGAKQTIKICCPRMAMAERILLSVPEFDFCGFVTSITLGISNINHIYFENGADHFVFDEIRDNRFYCDGRLVAEFSENTEFTLKKIKPVVKEHKFAQLITHLSEVPMSVICRDDDISEGDMLAFSYNGEDTIGIVKSTETLCEYEMAHPSTFYRIKYEKV